MISLSNCCSSTFSLTTVTNRREPRRRAEIVGQMWAWVCLFLLTVIRIICLYGVGVFRGFGWCFRKAAWPQNHPAVRIPTCQCACKKRRGMNNLKKKNASKSLGLPPTMFWDLNRPEEPRVQLILVLQNLVTFYFKATVFSTNAECRWPCITSSQRTMCSWI